MERAEISDQLQQVGVHFDGGGLIDEVEAQDHGGATLARFHQALDALQWTGADAHPRAGFDARGQTDFQAGFECGQDFAQLLRKGGLVKNIEQVGDMIVLADGGGIRSVKLQKNVSGKQGFLKNDRFAPVFVGRTVARQGGGKTLPLTVFNQFFFPARLGVGDEPEQFRHGRRIRHPLPEVNPKLQGRLLTEDFYV